MTTTAPEPPATYRGVFGNAQFRVILGITVLFVLGCQFEILALSVLVYARSGSPFLAAVAFGIGFFPQIVGGVLLSSLVDRLPARPVVVAALVVRAVPGLAIGTAPHLPVGAMLLVVAASAVTSPLVGAVTAGTLPQVLQGDGYVLGRAVLSQAGSGLQIVGLAAGGAVLAGLAAPDLLLLAGAGLLGAGVLARWGLRPHPARATPGRGVGVLRASLTGHARLLADRRLRGLLLIQWVPVSLVAGAESLLVPYAGVHASSGPVSSGTVSSGHASSGQAGVLLAALPTGMLLGDLVIGRFCRPATRTRLSRPLAVLLGVPLTGFALGPAVPGAVALLVVAGLGFSYLLGLQRRFLDAVPADLRGQVFGLHGAGLMGGQGTFAVIAGALSAVVGPAAAVAALGALTVATPLALKRPFHD